MERSTHLKPLLRQVKKTFATYRGDDEAAIDLQATDTGWLAMVDGGWAKATGDTPEKALRMLVCQITCKGVLERHNRRG